MAAKIENDQIKESNTGSILSEFGQGVAAAASFPYVVFGFPDDNTITSGTGIVELQDLPEPPTNIIGFRYLRKIFDMSEANRAFGWAVATDGKTIMIGDPEMYPVKEGGTKGKVMFLAIDY